jgi:hypothetical protein
MRVAKKKFGCVEMKREGAACVRAETASMKRAEQLEYWSRGTGELLAIQQALRTGKPVSTPKKTQT